MPGTEQVKRTYVAPTLQRLGDVSALTASGSGGNSEMSSQGDMMMA